MEVSGRKKKHRVATCLLVFMILVIFSFLLVTHACKLIVYLNVWLV